MAKAIELWNSKVSIPSMRRTAPQINPGIARMFPTTGLEKVGAALTDVGEQIHQVNIARQVASALAEYKMNAANFMATMQNADPSKVDFGQEFQKFIAQQGGLAAGVSRDASNIISAKLKSYGASTYGDIKRMEIRNTRGMALAEVPDVIENLTREQAEAEMIGDTVRAKRAEQDLNQYIAGIGPALRPYETVKIKAAAEDALDDARHDSEKQAVYNAILVNPDSVKELIDNAKYLSPQEKWSLTNSAKAKKKTNMDMSRFQKQVFKNNQSEVLLKQVFGGGAILTPPDLHTELQPVVDAINVKIASGMTNATNDVSHPIEGTLRHSINNLLTVANEADLLDALTVLSAETVEELYKANEQTKKLQKDKVNVIRVLRMLASAIGDAKELINLFDDPDIATVLRDQIDIENELLTADIKQRFIDGDKADIIAKDIADVFEAKSKGILEGFGMRKIKTGMNEYRRKYEKDQPTDVRRRAMINLLMSGDYERQIETAIDAGWFAIGDTPEPRPEPKPTPIGEVPVNYIPFMDGDNYYAAPIIKGQSEADAILTGLDTGNMKRFNTLKEVEKFSGSKVR